MSEYLYNTAVSYINQAGGLDDTATSVQLIDTALFPTVCNYRIAIESEICLVTVNVAGLLTITRGYEGTTATAHSNQLPVVLVTTAGGLAAWQASSEAPIATDNILGNNSGSTAVPFAISYATLAGGLTGTGADTLAAGNDARFFSEARNLQTGTSYALALTDAGGCVDCANAAPFTLTVTRDAIVTWIAGTIIEVCQYGAGAVTMAADTGVSLLSYLSYVVSGGQYTSVFLRYIGSNVWVLSGSLT